MWNLKVSSVLKDHNLFMHESLEVLVEQLLVVSTFLYRNSQQKHYIWAIFCLFTNAIYTHLLYKQKQLNQVILSGWSFLKFLDTWKYYIKKVSPKKKYFQWNWFIFIRPSLDMTCYGTAISVRLFVRLSGCPSIRLFWVFCF